MHMTKIDRIRQAITRLDKKEFTVKDLPAVDNLAFILNRMANKTGEIKVVGDIPTLGKGRRPMKVYEAVSIKFDVERPRDDPMCNWKEVRPQWFTIPKGGKPRVFDSWSGGERNEDN